MADFHELALTFVPGIGPVTAQALISRFGSAEAIFQATRKELKSVQELRPKSVESILNKDGFGRAEAELDFVTRFNITPLFFTHGDYPERLRQCNDAPVLLYFKGNAALNSKRVISIVGTRNATAYGRDLCNELIGGLKAHDVLVVSGLAYGVDIMAHKACLKEGIATVGALGHGLDRIYPALHRPSAEKMLENGGLITEFPSATNPDRENFPKRNRIIAGMADAIIVIEANLKGGALITAEIANSYSRDVFAYPGRTSDEFSSGCNYLIKTNRAHMITGLSDLEYMMQWAGRKVKKSTPQISLRLNLSVEEKKITDILEERGQVAIDELSLLAGMPQSKLAITTLNLEMQGIIVTLPGKMFRLS